MTDDYGLDAQSLLKLISDVADYIIIDIRTETSADEEGRFEESFQIEDYELPSDVNAVPSYFKSIAAIFVGDTPSVSSEWVNNYRSQDNNLTQLYYLNAPVSDVFSLAPEMKA